MCQYFSGDSFQLPVPNAPPINMIWCPPGKFQMGNANQNLSGNKDLLDITLNEGFWISDTVITIAQCCALDMNLNYGEMRTDIPMWFLHWEQSRDFCKKLKALFSYVPESIQQQFSVFDLPTEAQWEYACRAGTKTTWHFGESSDLLHEYAIFNLYGANVETIGVKQKKPNPWNIYDFYGLIGEWCRDNFLSYEYWEVFSDPYIDDEYEGLSKAAHDWNHKLDTQFKTIRGGYRWSDETECSSTYRYGCNKYDWEPEKGFRVVLEKAK